MSYNNDDEYDIQMNEKELFSHSHKDISSSSGTKSYSDLSSYSTGKSKATVRQDTVRKKNNKKKKKKHTLRNVVIVMLCLVVAFLGCFYAYTYNIINKIDRQPLDSNNLGIVTEDYGDVKNIALLGIDSREDNNVGRSDAIVILTVDKTHKKLKLTSIARDTYVAIDGHAKDKLTHAYAYGKSQLAVKTLNQNFDLEIKDYVTVNFFEFSRIIDYIGGVTIDVDKAEMDEMNTNIIPWMVKMGIQCDLITTPGEQILSGGQAVSYARIRHTDNDIVRGNRQKEVLAAMFAKAKKMNPVKLPELAAMVVKECQTSMSTNSIMNLGLWALTFSPEIVNLSIPNQNVPSSGKMIKGVWYFVYDLNVAKKEINDFIYEQNNYSKEAVEKQQSESSKK